MLLHLFDLSWKEAWIDSAISNILLLFICLLVMNTLRYYLPKREQYVNIFTWCVLLTLVWLLLSKWLLRITLGYHDESYNNMLHHSSGIRFSIAFLLLGCVTMISVLWYTWGELKENEKREADAEKLAKEAELFKLRQQMQPHFLFNSLNSISALTGSQPEKARHMIQQLSDFLRGTLKKEQQQWTIFNEELQYLQLYLDIEKVRFGYRLQTTIDCEPSTLQMNLPSMLLQPLVENAIKFGLYDTIGEITIFIQAKNVNGLLEVSVQNPFDELTSAPVKGTGFGLSSIRRRLFLLFGRQDLLQIKKEAEKFITTITIPQQHESNYN